MADQQLESIITRFSQSECSWLSTTRPDGRVHAAPVWHSWYQGRVYVVTKHTAVKVANILANPSVVITHPDPRHAIIIEGTARVVTGLDEALRPLFQARYDWDIITDEPYNTTIEIAAERLIAWGEKGAGHRRRWHAAEIGQVVVADPGEVLPAS